MMVSLAITMMPVGPAVPEYCSPSTVRRSNPRSVSNCVLYRSPVVKTSITQSSLLPYAAPTPSVTQRPSCDVMQNCGPLSTRNRAGVGDVVGEKVSPGPVGPGVVGEADGCHVAGLPVGGAVTQVKVIAFSVELDQVPLTKIRQPPPSAGQAAPAPPNSTTSSVSRAGPIFQCGWEMSGQYQRYWKVNWEVAVAHSFLR